MFHTVLIANRGEISVRIAKTLKKMGVKSVAVYSDADRNSAHVSACDLAICLGGNTAAESYLQVDRILTAARESGAQAIIPGYGFLSENAAFCEQCEAAGIAFCGPTPNQIREFGLKHTSREIAEKAGVPLTPGTGLLNSIEEAITRAANLGYPVMLKASPINGVIELSPGVHSLQINCDSRVIHQQELIAILLVIEEKLGDARDIKVPSRIVYIPMVFEDLATLDAVSRYRQSVRDTAPWLPSNTEFMRRINGLDSIDQVKNILFETSYMILGFGDVYLGTPCAVPVDPRHRLLASKYNPARTYTTEGTVGIGGVYMCIYGMDSPGGYQLLGRTLPIWNKFLKNSDFQNGKPWLLKLFDHVRNYEVSEDELTAQREAFREGKLHLRIEESFFCFAEHEKFLQENAKSNAEFKTKQQFACNSSDGN